MSGDSSIDKIKELINEIYNRHDIQENYTKTIFLTSPYKVGANEFELTRTISILSCITKLMRRMLINRAQSRIRPLMGEEQSGFVKDTRTRNAIFIIRENDANTEGCVVILYRLRKSICNFLKPFFNH